MVLRAAKKLFGGFLFFGSKAGVHFCGMNGAATQDVLASEDPATDPATTLIVESANHDASCLENTWPSSGEPYVAVDHFPYAAPGPVGLPLHRAPDESHGGWADRNLNRKVVSGPWQNVTLFVLNGFGIAFERKAEPPS